LAANIPAGLDIVSQAFTSDVGVDNRSRIVQGAMSGTTCSAFTPSRERSLDEVKDQVEAKWRDDQIANRLRTKATTWCKARTGRQSSRRGDTAGLQVETAGGQTERGFNETSRHFLARAAMPQMRPAVLRATGAARSH